MQEKVNKIIQADCLEYLKELPNGCVDLVLKKCLTIIMYFIITKYIIQQI